MSESAPRTAIPADFVSLDSRIHTSGSATHAMLGARVAQRSRWLHANLRRGFSEAWPENQAEDQPAIWSGMFLGPYPWIPTPGLREGRWYLIANIPIGWSVRVVPFCGPDRPVRMWRDSDYECVGTGAKAQYGPITMDMRGIVRPSLIGVVLYLDIDGVAATATGNVKWASDDTLISTAAGFGGITIPGSLVRILDAAGDPITGWSSVIKVDSGGTMVLAVPLLIGSGLTITDADAATWELYQATGEALLVTVAWFEMPLTGRL